MRGNRRYVMSRTNRRAMAPVVDDEDSSVASVDTNYLRKLIKTGDTGFIDELLVGGNGDNQHYKKEDDADTIIQGTADDLKYNTSVNKQPKRWPYVVFGMGLMYVILVLWEGRNNRAWWNSYMTDLKSSQSATTMDSYFASRGSAGGGITVNAYDDVNAVDPLYSNSYNTAGGTTNSQGYGTTTTGLRGGQQQSTSSSIFKTPTWQQPANNNNQQQTYQQQPQQTQQQYQQQPQQQQQQQYPQIAGGLSSGTLGVGSTSNSNTGRSSLQSPMMNTGRSTGSSSSILPLFSNNQQQRSTSSTDETQPLWSGSGTTTNSNRALATGSTTTTTLNNGGSNMNSLYSSSGGGSTASLQGGGGNMNTLYNNGGGGGGSMNSLYSGGNNMKSAGSSAGGQQQLNSQQFGGAAQQLHP